MRRLVLLLAAALGAAAAVAAEPEHDADAGGNGGDFALEAEAGPEPESERDAVGVDEDILARSDGGRSITLLVDSDGSETYADLAKRVAGAPERGPALAAANGSHAAGRPAGRILVPWELVRDEYRYLALRALFPADGFVDGAWRHDPLQARAPGAAEALWQVALWFTGDGARWPEIAAANELDGPTLPSNRPVDIPERLLLPLFKPAVRGPAGLVYKVDRRGPFAEYRLAQGEALYSAVIVRFTDLTRPADVTAAAEVVRARSGIEDVRKIEIGRRVRIPLQMLATAYLPANHPRRVLAALHEDEIEEIRPAPRALELAGVHVLLDPGHGGDDVGARNGRIWESDYVYDVACRVQRLLRQKTSARVRLLVRDTEHGCTIFDRKAIPQNRLEVVDSKPPLPIRRGATRESVNGRYKLANEIYRELTNGGGVDRDNVIFLSLHADSLHRSLRGSTAYVPGERFRTKSDQARAPSRAERLRHEAVSRRLADALIESYRVEGLPVHENRPVRDHVTRGRGNKASSWVPAVLRGTAIPARVLLETVNINNPQDAKLLEDPQGRERIARAVVAGLLRFYSGEQLARSAAREGAKTGAHGGTAAGRPAGGGQSGAR